MSKKQMNQTELLAFFKKQVMRSFKFNQPHLSEEELVKIQKETVEVVSMETSFNQLGLDSISLTWIIVQIENELNIDASEVSFFEIHTVGEFCQKIEELLHD